MMKNSKLNQKLFFSGTNEFLNKYLPNQAVKSANTINTYRDALTIFRRFVTDVRKISIKKFLYVDCTHDFLLDYLAHLKTSGCAETTCNNRLAAIRAYLWYVADGDVSMQSIALSASNVPFLKEPKVTRNIISESDFAALLSAPPNTKLGIRDRTIMILLYDSAVRVSELLDLNVSSLNLMTSTPYIKIHGKGDKERVVAITDKTVGHLKLYIRHFHPKAESNRPLFYTVIKGNMARMSPGNVARLIRKYAEQIRPQHPELPKQVHCHMFRRTRATNLYQNGVELELVSRILGHSSTQTTRIYATPSIEMMKEAMSSSNPNIPEEEPMWLDDEKELARLCGLR
jgi:site-specific recombinase XerD